jgi:hypothetical protein
LGVDDLESHATLAHTFLSLDPSFIQRAAIRSTAVPARAGPLPKLGLRHQGSLGLEQQTWCRQPQRHCWGGAGCGQDNSLQRGKASQDFRSRPITPSSRSTPSGTTEPRRPGCSPTAQQAGCPRESPDERPTKPVVPTRSAPHRPQRPMPAPPGQRRKAPVCTQ